MDKTITEKISSGGSPSISSENPPSFQAGFTDFGEGQSLLCKEACRSLSAIIPTKVAELESKTPVDLLTGSAHTQLAKFYRANKSR